MDLSKYAKKTLVQLTTTGRKSGKKFTVGVWFVVTEPSTIVVQHVRGAPANWYKNLVKNSDVEVDFGEGPLKGKAVAITDPAGIARVLGSIRKKHWLMGPLLQLGSKAPVAASIRV